MNIVLRIIDNILMPQKKSISQNQMLNISLIAWNTTTNVIICKMNSGFIMINLFCSYE